MTLHADTKQNKKQFIAMIQNFQPVSLKACLLATLLFAFSATLSAQTLIEKADKQYELHAYRLAAQSYEQLLQRETIEDGVLSKLADCYLQTNQIGKAANAFSRAALSKQMRPDDNLTYGRVLMMLGRYDEAMSQFDAVRTTAPAVAEHFKKACRFAKENDDNAGNFQVTNFAKANTAAADFSPSIWRDQVMWSSARTDMARTQEKSVKKDWSGTSSANQMFAGAIENVSTQAFQVRFLKNDFKNVPNESNPSFSADGKTVAFMRNNFADGNRISSNGGLEMSIYIATADDEGGWSDAKAFPYNGLGYSTGFPCLSPDGNTLYFASNRPNGQGGFDIYQSKKRGSSWGEPINLGTSINTPGDDITPYTDGKTLYFASDWHLGYGGFDIFKSTGLNAEVQNMGAPINTSSDDFGFIYPPSVNSGFFTSNRSGGKGKEDIYRVESRSERVNIVVVDKSTGKPITDATVSVKEGNKDNLASIKTGNYLADLGDGKSIVLEVKKGGFKTESVTVEPTFANKTRVLEVGLVREVPTQMSVVPQAEYTGIVSDAMTGIPIEGVLIKMTNQETNQQIEVKTNATGRYRVNIPANSTQSYLLTYSIENFEVSQKFIKANELKNKYLGEIPLTPSATTGRNPKKVEEPEKGKQETRGIPRPIANPNTPKGETPKEYSVTTTNVPVSQAEYKGEPRFTVQLLSASMDAVVNLSTYANLKPLGNLYSVLDGGTQKIRLGIFEKRDDAQNALKKAADLGYKGAFVMEEKNANAVGNYIFTVPKPDKPAIPKEMSVVVPPKSPVKTEEPKKEETPKSPVKIDDKTFKVRIAAMRKPDWFDDSKVSKMWKVERWAEGDLTLFVMDGFKTLEDAKAMKKRVQAAGYADAKVVVRQTEGLKVVD
jgi:5-hydroxyisourate hydrolase-like protein (transthyretin family)